MTKLNVKVKSLLSNFYKYWRYSVLVIALFGPNKDYLVDAERGVIIDMKTGSPGMMRAVVLRWLHLGAGAGIETNFVIGREELLGGRA